MIGCFYYRPRRVPQSTAARSLDQASPCAHEGKINFVENQDGTLKNCFYGEEPEMPRYQSQTVQSEEPYYEEITPEYVEETYVKMMSPLPEQQPSIGECSNTMM